MKKSKEKNLELKKALYNAFCKKFLKSSLESATFSKIFKTLNVSKSNENIIKNILYNLEKKGKITLQGKTVHFGKKKTTVIGTFSQAKRGFGFVKPSLKETFSKEIFIPPPFTAGAVQGDSVEVLLKKTDSPKGPEGEIIKVLKRAHKTLIGTVISNASQIAVVYSPLLGPKNTITIPHPPKKALKVGDHVRFEILAYKPQKKGNLREKGKELQGKFNELLGNLSDPNTDDTIAASAFNIPLDFPEKVMKEVDELPSKVTKKDLKNRIDLTHLRSITIDPCSAKDFDDALSLSKDKNGKYHLGVHIADVSYYVKPGTNLDKEAFFRANSTYLTGKCLPMLPEKISNGLSSLKPNIIRLSISILMTMDSNGNIIKTEVVRSYIKSQKRLTYLQAKDILEGKTESPFKKDVLLMVELCKQLKKLKAKRGNIDLVLPGLEVQLDDKGFPSKLNLIEYDITHQLVEEFMLLANEAVAKYLSQRGKQLPFRIHEEPNEDNLQAFAAICNYYNFSLTYPFTAKKLQKTFAEIAQSNVAKQMSIAFIKCMKLAFYSQDNIGHYGLQLDYYTHFTSPIRRYVDLVIHRILFDEYKELPDLREISQRCSDRERISAKAENHVKTLKILRLLNTHFKKTPDKTYPAVITKIKEFGILFELIDFMVDGYLSLSQIDVDYFEASDNYTSLKGVHSGKTISIGTELEVYINHIDLITLQVEYEFCKFKPIVKTKKR